MYGRLVAAGVEELLGVVVPRFPDVLGAGDDVMHQVQREEVRLLIVAPG
jgi:hypothetical protein